MFYLHACMFSTCVPVGFPHLGLPVVIKHHMDTGNSAVSSVRAAGSQQGPRCSPVRWLSNRENHLLITRVLKSKADMSRWVRKLIFRAIGLPPPPKVCIHVIHY